ncbi:MAG TPA: hypothetical protein PKC14_04140 [Candidatus Absconditabacterales bacterium]|nr:hypothetical protein [Candidatus Absconditabacterales bacterium]
MKQRVKFIFYFSCILLTFLLSSCKKEDIKNITTFNETNLNCIPEGITIDDFRKAGKLWTDEKELQKLIFDKKIGNSSDNPYVAIGFDEAGFLYTTEKFNKELLSGTLNISFSAFTDLETFRKVTGCIYATSEYSDVIDGVWTFDAFVKFFTKRSDKLKAVEEKTKSLLPYDIYLNSLMVGVSFG